MHLLLIALSFPPEIDSWKTLVEGDVWVGCAEADDSKWCRAIAEIPTDQATLAKILADVENYPQVIKRISSSRIVAPDIVHITLDMPFPVSSRDYVAKFTKGKEGDVIVYKYQSVVHEDAPESEKAVRLPKAGGEWRIESLGDSSKLTYTWNGELGGDFPEWALPQAWSTQGSEVMNWLTEAVK